MADNISKENSGSVSSKERPGSVSLLAVFPDLAPAADAIDKLRALGLSDDQMNVISGIPVTEAMLGRPSQWTNVPRLAARSLVFVPPRFWFSSHHIFIQFRYRWGGKPLFRVLPRLSFCLN